MSCRIFECMSCVRKYYKWSIYAFEMAGGWTAKMMRAIVSVWGQAKVQSELDQVVQNRTIYKKICTCIIERGSNVEQR